MALQRAVTKVQGLTLAVLTPELMIAVLEALVRAPVAMQAEATKVALLVMSMERRLWQQWNRWHSRRRIW